MAFVIKSLMMMRLVFRIPSSRSNKPHTIAFNSDGSLKYVELKIMNLRPPSESHPISNKWEEIGVWNSEKGKNDKSLDKI